MAHKSLLRSLLVGLFCIGIADDGIAIEGQTIRLIVSNDNTYTRETANQLRKLLEQLIPAIVLETVDAASPSLSGLPPARLVVTVGDSASKAVNAELLHEKALLAVMPQRATYSAIARRSQRTSAIYLDQPVGRMLNLISIIKPDDARLGVVLGPSSTALSSSLLAAANERKQSLHLETVSEESGVGKVLAGVIHDANILLAIPDAVVHTAYTVQPILLMSYQAGIPVVGYSAAYQRAGAMVVLYTTPAQLAQQAAEVVIAYYEGKGLPSPQEPKYFTIGINTTVARSLAINLPVSEVIEQKLRSMKE